MFKCDFYICFCLYLYIYNSKRWYLNKYVFDVLKYNKKKYSVKLF